MGKRVIILAALLTGCAAPQVKVERVEVPVREPCVKHPLPQRPVKEFGATVGTYPGDVEAVKKQGKEKGAWEKYANGLEAAFAGCLDLEKSSEIR